ncbi:PQQ-like beta-propeller repeat protein [Gemmata sp. JC673]|uniref:PQQ-like beta-propeller repeat protein n=1 Tax=Gemmata algarum TaxID=2975278 RepID=A0ABU5F4L9_9BACT|nr:PQQ-binding-like beta-propeller repeat protein [Gemmata algarum]MDY3562510.1 PQQ-like beta-propeller repeat protein [Gemmata algarum]
MPRAHKLLRRSPALGLALAVLAGPAHGDWPQWRGPNRDGRAADFQAPKTWPKELTQKWKVTVGDGVATPALVGDKLFAFTREGGAEVARCLEAATGKEVWIEKYDAAFKGGADSGFPGPRASPAVAQGKVVTLGVNGTLSALDAATGKKVWRVETKGIPRFHTSSSPVVADGLVVAQFGGESGGGVAAYELASGKEQWQWTNEGTAYASPVLMTVGDTKTVVAETSASIIGLDLKTGQLLWKTAFAVTGRGYNSSTPVVEGNTVIFSGANRGTRAFTVEKKGDTFEAKETWANKDQSVLYNTPVVRGKSLFGLTASDALFCVSAETGKTAWTEPLTGGRGYGNIVDAGAVLLALPPNGQLTVFEPSDKEYKKVANYKVGTSATYAYPIATGNRIYVKDKDSITLWTVE